jgi:hypothetical protein
MGIKVSFLESGPAAVAASAPQVPADAVVSDKQSTFVWVVRDGKVEKRAVRAGTARDGQVPITQGLQGGEAVVVEPPRRLRDGATVELQAAT